MKAYIKERTLQEANHILETTDTIRTTAKFYSLSKSTVHNDLSNRLPELDFEKAKEVQKILDENFSEKHIRGGQATKLKYKKSEKAKSHEK